MLLVAIRLSYYNIVRLWFKFVDLLSNYSNIEAKGQETSGSKNWLEKTDMTRRCQQRSNLKHRQG